MAKKLVDTKSLPNIGKVITSTFDSKSSIVVQPQKTLNATDPVKLTSGPYNNQEYILIGETPNDGNGDPLRVAFGKINNNFSNLFLTTTVTSTAYTNGITPNQVVFQVPITQFYQGQFQIRSSGAGPDMQDITLSASITNNLAGVRFTGHSTLFQGNAICRYDMDILNSNVRVLINPLTSQLLEHFVAARITYPNVVAPPGTDIGLNNYPDGYVMGTEDGLILTTESE
jgi:hypothetical protein